MGTGILNWVFAIPAFLTINTQGRRYLLLFTLPWLAIWLLWSGFLSGSSPTARSVRRDLGWSLLGMLSNHVVRKLAEKQITFLMK